MLRAGLGLPGRDRLQRAAQQLADMRAGEQRERQHSGLRRAEATGRRTDGM